MTDRSASESTPLPGCRPVYCVAGPCAPSCLRMDDPSPIYVPDDRRARIAARIREAREGLPDKDSPIIPLRRAVEIYYGRSAPTARELTLYAEACGVSVDWLLTGAEPGRMMRGSYPKSASGCTVDLADVRDDTVASSPTEVGATAATPNESARSVGTCGTECSEGHTYEPPCEHAGCQTGNVATCDLSCPVHGEPPQEQRRPDNPAPDDQPRCVCGDPIEPWTGPGSDTPCTDARPAPDDQLHDQIETAISDAHREWLRPGSDAGQHLLADALTNAVIPVIARHTEQLRDDVARYEQEVARLNETNTRLQRDAAPAEAALDRVRALLDRHAHRVAIDPALIEAALDPDANHGTHRPGDTDPDTLAALAAITTEMQRTEPRRPFEETDRA